MNNGQQIYKKVEITINVVYSVHKTQVSVKEWDTIHIMNHVHVSVNYPAPTTWVKINEMKCV